MSGMMQAEIIKEIAQDVREDIKDGIHMAQAKRTQERGFKHNERMYRNRYQWMQEDLKKAGLSPLLAYGASPGTPGGGAAAVAPTVHSGKGQSLSQAKLRDSEEALIAENIKTAKTQQGVNTAQQEKTEADKLVADQLNNKLGQEVINLQTQDALNNALKVKTREDIMSREHDNKRKQVQSDLIDGVRNTIGKMSAPGNKIQKFGEIMSKYDPKNIVKRSKTYKTIKGTFERALQKFIGK